MASVDHSGRIVNVQVLTGTRSAHSTRTGRIVNVAHPIGTRGGHVTAKTGRLRAVTILRGAVSHVAAKTGIIRAVNIIRGGVAWNPSDSTWDFRIIGQDTRSATFVATITGQDSLTLAANPRLIAQADAIQSWAIRTFGHKISFSTQEVRIVGAPIPQVIVIGRADLHVLHSESKIQRFRTLSRMRF